MKAFLLLAMVFLHIFDDFKMQGILASMKQKDWWKENCPDELFKYDYIISLLAHSFSWTFAIMLPVFYYVRFHLTAGLVTAFAVNVIIHCFIDDLKANKHKINLIHDQLTHIVQIVVTWLIFVIVL